MKQHWALLALTLVGCTETVDSGVASTESLSLPATPAGALRPVGVTLDDDGDLVVAYDTGDLWKRVGDSWEPLSTRAQNLSVRYTDVIALGGDRYALSARNDGFVLDLEADTFEEAFCYLPDSEDWAQPPQEVPTTPPYQVSHALAYDVASKTIFAMPETRTDRPDQRLGTFLATYEDAEGDGQPTHWQPLTASPAEGLAFEPNRSHLWALTVEEGGTFIDEWALDMTQSDGFGSMEGRTRIEASEATGLAIDFEQGRAYVLDRDRIRIFSLEDIRHEALF